MGSGDRTFGDECFVAGGFEAVADGAIADLSDEQAYGEEVTETGGGSVVTTRVDAGPASLEAFELAVEFVIETAQKGVLAGFHVAEEVRKMNDASHVGFVKLDTALDFEGGAAHGTRGSARAGSSLA